MKQLFLLSIIFCNAQFFLFAETEGFQKHYKVAVVGTGYVGLVLGTGLSDERFGHSVCCIDIDTKKITQLQEGIIPFFEPDLSDLVLKNVAQGRLRFTTDANLGMQDAEIIFIAVGTPSRADGSVDTSFLMPAIARILEHTHTPKIICIKSTVPIGTCSLIESMVEQSGKQDLIAVVSNPEFLREGSAVHDFFNPDRIVIGATQQHAQMIIKDLYAPFMNSVPFLITDPTTSETIKYASNAFLATKISYINEIAHLCEKTGADVFDVAKGMGLDIRIGHHFLKPGPGFGGSCFPKDTLGLLKKAEEYGIELSVIRAALQTNEYQKKRIVKIIKELLHHHVAGKTIGILGLAFKANTDDVRESPAIDIIKNLLHHGCFIKAYDPLAMENMKKIIPGIEYCESVECVAQGADILVMLTEGDEFYELDLPKIGYLMTNRVILDTRNIFYKKDIVQRSGFQIYIIGRKL